MDIDDLDDLLAQEDSDVEVIGDVDLILDEEDEHHENEAIKLLSQERRSILPEFERNETLSNMLIAKYITRSFKAQTQEIQIPQFEVPIQIKESRLDELEKQETQIIEDTRKLTLENLRAKPQPIQNVQIHQLKTLSANLTNTFMNNKFKQPISGQPCVIKQCPGVSICVGTTTGDIAVFSSQNFDSYVVLKYQSKVNTIDLIQDGYLLLAGYESGHIVLWDPNSGTLQKVHDNETPITSCKFYNDSKLFFIFADYLGFTFQVKIIKFLFSYSFEVQKLFATRNILPFYQICAQQAHGLVSLACLEFIQVIKVENKQTILKISRNMADDFKYPTCSWGLLTNSEGFTETLDTSLSVSWGPYIEVYRLSPNLELKFSCVCLLGSNILSCSWISRDMLIVIDKDFRAIVLNTQLFDKNILPKREVLLTSLQSPVFNHASIQSIDEVGQINNPQNYRNSKLQNVQVYTNCICASPMTTLFYCTTAVIKRGKLLIWSEYLKLLIERAEHPDQWYQILLLGLQLYWGQLHCFAQHPNQIYDQRIIIADISKDICGTFISLIGQKIESMQVTESQKLLEWSEAILAAIEYCIECNQQSYLFTGLRNYMIKFCRYNEFLNSLEIFINKQQIKQVPSDVLYQISIHYKEHKKTIKSLLFNLDIKSIDIGMVYKICLQCDVYTPLIVVCPRIGSDYITPLQKMYQKYLQNDSSMLLKCLWFIRLTLRRVLFPHDVIPYEDYCNAIRQQIMWLLIPDIFGSFLRTYTDELFEVLEIAMKDPCAAILSQDDKAMNMYVHDQQPIQSALVVLIYQNLNSYGHFARFVSDLNLKDVPLPQEVMLRVIQSLVQQEQFDRILYTMDFIDLASKVMLSSNDSIQALFLDTKQAFQLLIDAKDHRIFSWIQKHIHRERILIIKGIHKHFQQLISLNLQLMSRIPLTELEWFQILNREYCDGYLELLESLHPQNKLLRSLYIDKMCIWQKDIVINKIEDYPLDELEEIFLRNDHKEGLGYVYCKFGKFELAFQFFTWCLQDALEQGFRKALTGQGWTSMEPKFRQLYQLAQDAMDHDRIDYFTQLGRRLFNEQNHYNLWSLVYSCNNDNYESMIPFLQSINEQLSLLYHYLSKYNILDLITLIEEESATFNMAWIRMSFSSLFENHQIHCELLRKAESILNQHFILLKHRLLIDYQNSTQKDETCSQCNQIYDSTPQHILIRKCSHTTHQSCLTVPYCNKCTGVLQMQLESVIQNKLKQANEMKDLKIREQLIRDLEMDRSNRMIDQQFEVTQADLGLYQERKMLMKLDLYMQHLDLPAQMLKFTLLDSYAPLQSLTQKIRPDLKPSHVGLAIFGIFVILSLFGIAPRTIITLSGFLIPTYSSIEKMQKEDSNLYEELPYFLIFSGIMIVHGWMSYIFSFIPFFQTIYLLLVISLYHPDIHLARSLWNAIQSI